MEYVQQGTPICEVCNSAPNDQADGIARCKCPDKKWFRPNPVRADNETETLLNRKGFSLAPCGWYYYSYSGPLLTVFKTGDWVLESASQPTTRNLVEYLSSLPDMAKEG
jgi:hypothetical protein